MIDFLCGPREAGRSVFPVVEEKEGMMDGNMKLLALITALPVPCSIRLCGSSHLQTVTRGPLVDVSRHGGRQLHRVPYFPSVMV